jgi:hypothetical protein
VGSRAGLDAVVKRKIPNPRREWDARTPMVSPTETRKTYEEDPESNLTIPQHVQEDGR